MAEKMEVEVDFKYRGETPLLWAARDGQIEIVESLLKTGRVDVNVLNTEAMTPLERAAESGHNAIVQLLIDASRSKDHCLND